MASTLMLLLLLVSLASASHFYGGTATVTYKGRNPDGSFKLNIHNRDTFDGCQFFLGWHCYRGNCGSDSRIQRGILDRSFNAPQYENQWCETETVETRIVQSDKPFQLRVPQNCPRTYKLMADDPDGDNVRCRYGNVPHVECSACNQPSGFSLDQGSCSLNYHGSTANPTPYGFELVVEDFPRSNIILTYTDGSQSSRAPLTVRGKRAAWWWTSTTSTAPTTSTTAATTSTAPTTSTTAATTSTAPTTSTTAATTSTAPTTSTTAATTSTAPTTSTTAATTSTAPTTSTTAATTSTAPTTAATTSTAPTTSTTVATTSTAPTTSTTAATTSTAPTTSTTAATTSTAPTTSTTAATTSTAPTTSTTAATTSTAPTTSTTVATTSTAPTTSTTAATTSTAPTTATTPPTTGPLSKLPLQFSFLVDPPAPSCEEGLYLPEFMHPTPENGARIQAQVNKEVEIRVKAKAKYATIDDIIFSGPLNTNKHRTTHDEFVIKWTPVPDDLGDQYPVCFAVESVTGSDVSTPPVTHHHHHHHTPSSQSGIYQSEMRCVLVVVMEELVKSNVICRESTMTVEVEKSSFPGLQEDHLRLSDGTNTACSLQKHSNSTHIIGVIPLNACGTEIEEDEENIIFKNEIITVDDVRALITRKHMLEVQFYCVYPKHGNVSASFSAHRTDVTVWEKGLGTFTYRFEFYPDSQFKSPIDPNSYPLEYDIGSRIYMQIEAVSTVNNTMLFVESCKAAPYDNPNYSPSYSIIDHGCKMDMTVEMYSPSYKRQFRFSMEAFKFIGLYEQVYISCSVLICEAGNPETRCAKGCMESGSWPNLHESRRKREAVTQSSKHFISQGPLRLRRSLEITGPPTVVNLNMNLIFIAGCLLAAVGMICAVAMYKVKMSKVKYQPLPAYEN